MPKISLLNGQDITVLGVASNSYILTNGNAVGSTFTLHGIPVTPIVDECESDGAQTVEVNTIQVIDNLGNVFFELVGGRPRTRVRK